MKSSEYSTPVLGLIFLRYADHKFTIARQELEGKSTSVRTCDLLLTKLISGEMDVEKINILMPEKEEHENQNPGNRRQIKRQAL
ncbi:MAG: type I restriction-modification system subunit M N-terminal domain-containing protein [ANME-2 cluster archaeon]|nr:type I restriction-modification system subunit M N-terminal domain-containing protein [ANME-2 cluster archaeon]